MSIDTCVVCSKHVDTDEDCDAYFISYDGIRNTFEEIETTHCHCGNCRHFKNRPEANKHILELKQKFGY